ADSVELKMTVGDGDRHSAITGLDVLDAQLRQVVFFDTPDLTPPRLALRASPAPTPGSRARSSRAPRSRPPGAARLRSVCRAARRGVATGSRRAEHTRR